MSNKVLFGLSNVHFAPLTFDSDGNPIYGTPHKHPGAVSLTLDTSGSSTPFYADNIVYYTAVANQGYTGTMEFAMLDEWFLMNILNETKDADGVIIENANAEPSKFAMMFQVEGDKNAAKRVLYNVQASRAGEAAKTKGESTEPQTASVSITATPLPNSQDIKASTTHDTPREVVDNWFKQVHLRRGESAENVDLESLSLGSAELVPFFDPQITAYTAHTANASNTINAAAESADAQISISVNGEFADNFKPITWNSGENSVVITVSGSAASKVYTITVTKGEDDGENS